MTAPVRCFLLEPTARVRAYTRVHTLYKYFPEVPRCTAAPDSDRMGLHEARRFLGEREYPILVGEVDGSALEIEKTLSPDQWPLFCDKCGRPFGELEGVRTDVVTYRIWRSDDGREWADDIAPRPPGAMCRTWWYERLNGYGGPDGRVYSVICPDGVEWIVDSPARNGAPDRPGWTRTGVAPDFTAEPSIDTQTWHGFLERGWLVLDRSQAPA